MNKPAIIAIAASLIVLGLSPAASESKISKPRSNEVILVTRFVVTPSLDMDFFAHYAEFEGPGAEGTPDSFLKDKSKIPGNTLYLQVNEPGKEETKAKRLSSGLFGEFNFTKVSIPKNREIEVDGARVYLTDNAFLFFGLPLVRKVVIPEGANYVYLGSFNYAMKDDFFNFGSITQLDEYDAAVKAVSDKFGKVAELVRVNLLSLEEEKK
jgi:hypothetical protein